MRKMTKTIQKLQQISSELAKISKQLNEISNEIEDEDKPKTTFHHPIGSGKDHYTHDYSYMYHGPHQKKPRREIQTGFIEKLRTGQEYRYETDEEIRAKGREPEEHYSSKEMEHYQGLRIRQVLEPGM